LFFSAENTPLAEHITLTVEKARFSKTSAEKSERFIDTIKEIIPLNFPESLFPERQSLRSTLGFTHWNLNVRVKTERVSSFRTAKAQNFSMGTLGSFLRFPLCPEYMSADRSASIAGIFLNMSVIRFSL